MLSFLLQPDFWLLAVGTIFVVRQLCLILAAEQGRKHDLVKKLYKASLDFHISVLIPYLDSAKLDQLKALVKSIEHQDYPAIKVSVHIVATEQTISDISTIPFHPNVKIWTYPALRTSFGDAVHWLIERCMAQGNSGLITVFKPDDIIKPDFFQNIVARSFDSNILQGYVAIKQRPETILGRVLSLSDRIANRIDNAGRYHLGMSCQLMDSGWVVKQEVLEMIPFQRGWDVNNFEYTLMLNIQNFKVTWAPNVVVYTDEQADFVSHLTDCIAGFFNRLKLLFQYGFKLLMVAAEEMDYAYFEQFLNIVKPPAFVLGAFLIAMSVQASVNPQAVLGAAFTWQVLTGAFFLTQLLALFVSRCRTVDYVTYFVFTPVVYLVGLFVFPVAMINYIAGLMVRAGYAQEERSYRKIVTTRFNEELDPYPTLLDPENMVTSSAHVLDTAMMPAKDIVKVASAIASKNHAEKPPIQGSFDPVLHAEERGVPVKKSVDRTPREKTKMVMISNGKKEISCELTAKTTYTQQGEELYQLVLQYKTLAFSTATYKILDQAFYEMMGKLSSKGFTLQTCGSCGNFYNPSADMPGALKNAGVCLFGKMGKDVNLSTDAVTVLTDACPYHCNIESRETILKEWRNSLSLLTSIH
jgi:hypothetical protein